MTQWGSAPCPSLVLQGKILVLALSAVHHAVAGVLPTAGSPQPLLRGGHHPAHPARLALGCRNSSTSPPGVGLSARGFPNQLALGQHEAAVPLCQGFGSRMMADLCSCPRDLSQSDNLCVHTQVVVGTATIGSSTEWRLQLPPWAAISASAPASEG